MFLMCFKNQSEKQNENEGLTPVILFLSLNVFYTNHLNRFKMRMNFFGAENLVNFFFTNAFMKQIC
jgi:hypothetical protein